MWKSLCKWLLYRCMGWTCNVTEPHPDKYIICFAPHTSNWDFIIGQLYSGAAGFRSNFLMKKEWFFWPLGPLFRRLGGIPVWRSKHCHLTDVMAEEARRMPTFHLCISPEGTRSRTAEWKKGFYYIAQKAGLPILLYGVDYDKRLIQCTKTIVPNGDIDGQMAEIKQYYKDFKGKNPGKFTVGEL